MKCLLLDIGSTFIKYTIYDTSSCEAEISDSIPFPPPVKRDGTSFIVSSEEIRKVILSIFRVAGSSGCRQAYISVQMHGYVLKCDNDISDYVSWRDKSGDVTNTIFCNVNFNHLGTSLKNNLPLTKLAGKDIKGEFFTLGSFVSWILTGKNATHITDACASGFFYAQSGSKNEFSGKLVMPEVFKKITAIGSHNGIMVFTPAGDHQVSFLGSGATEKYLVNIGTATQISCLDKSSYSDGDYEKRPYFDSNILYTVSGLTGGDSLYKGEGKETLLDELKKAMEILPDKSEIIFGGGGANQFFEYFSSMSDKKCSLAQNNIGYEGLKIMANNSKPLAGTMLSEISFPNFPVIAKNCGLDFIIIDNEHGYFDYPSIAALIMNAKLINLETIVRIGDSSRAHITKLADMGVTGFLLPMTNKCEDIAKVVQYAKYSPEGKRGVSTTRAHTLYNPPKLSEYMESANKKMKIYAQIETLSGIENAEEILKTDGVTGIFIGPNDLSVDLGCLEDKTVLESHIISLASISGRIGKPWGIITGDKKLISLSVEHGADMISVGSELNMLINGCKKITEEF